jgi:hypothetical protein
MTPLPPMTCDRCGDCCTLVLCGQYEYDAVLAYAAEHAITPRKQGIRCPFFQEKRCAVYPVRPMICRLFGHSPRLVCANGHNRNVSAGVEKRFAGSAPHERSLHEAAGWTANEILTLVTTFGVR